MIELNNLTNTPHMGRHETFHSARFQETEELRLLELEDLATLKELEETVCFYYHPQAETYIPMKTDFERIILRVFNAEKIPAFTKSYEYHPILVPKADFPKREIEINHIGNKKEIICDGEVIATIINNNFAFGQMPDCEHIIHDQRFFDYDDSEVFRCDCCDSIYHNDATSNHHVADTDETICDNCTGQYYWDENREVYLSEEPRGFRPMEYHATSARWADGAEEAKYRIGFEIEKTEDKDEMPSIDGKRLLQETNWRLELDGSVEWELISPTTELSPECLTYKAIIANSELKRMVTAEWDEETCGGHVNISRKGLTGKEFWQQVKPITPILLAIWHEREEVVYCAPKKEKEYSDKKYAAVRVHQNYVEFRLVGAVLGTQCIKERELLFWHLCRITESTKGSFARTLVAIWQDEECKKAISQFGKLEDILELSAKFATKYESEHAFLFKKGQHLPTRAQKQIRAEARKEEQNQKTEEARRQAITKRLSLTITHTANVGKMRDGDLVAILDESQRGSIVYRSSIFGYINLTLGGRTGDSLSGTSYTRPQAEAEKESHFWAMTAQEKSRLRAIKQLENN